MNAADVAAIIAAIISLLGLAFTLAMGRVITHNERATALYGRCADEHHAASRAYLAHDRREGDRLCGRGQAFRELADEASDKADRLERRLLPFLSRPATTRSTEYLGSPFGDAT